MFETTKQKTNILKLLDELKIAITNENLESIQKLIKSLHKELFQIDSLISDDSRIEFNKTLYEKKNKNMLNFLKNQSNIDPKIMDFLSD